MVDVANNIHFNHLDTESTMEDFDDEIENNIEFYEKEYETLKAIFEHQRAGKLVELE